MSKNKGKSVAKVQNSEASEDETQFEPHSDDDLYDVVEILNEKANGTYLVRWAGTDPQGKPWPDSWVPRKDITDDLVIEWRKKKAKKRKVAREKRKQGHSRRTEAKVYRASESTTASKPDSTSTVRNAPRRSLNSSPPNLRKRKKAVSAEYIDDGSEENTAHSSPRKRQRLNGSIGSGTSKPKRVYSLKAMPMRGSDQSRRHSLLTQQQQEEEEEEEEEGEDEERVEKGRKGGTAKRREPEQEEDDLEQEEDEPEREGEDHQEGQQGESEPLFLPDFEPSPRSSLGRRRASTPESMSSFQKEESLSPSKWTTRNLKSSMKRRSVSSHSKDHNDSLVVELSSKTKSRPDSTKSQRVGKPAPAGSRSRSVQSSRHPLTSPVANADEDRGLYDDDSAYTMKELPFSQADEHEVEEPVINGTIVAETQTSGLSEKGPPSQPLDSFAPVAGSSMEAQDGSHVSIAHEGKSLKPILVVTPSKFRPHLPQAKIVKPISKLIGNGGLPSSSIDTNFTQQKKASTSEQGFHDDIEESSSLSLHGRGQQLVEEYHRQNDKVVPRRSLDDVLNVRQTLARSGSRSSQAPTFQDDDALVQHMEDQFVDLDGQGGVSPTMKPDTMNEDSIDEEPSVQPQGSSQVVELSAEVPSALGEDDDSAEGDVEDDIKSIARSLSVSEEYDNVPEDDPFYADDHQESSRPHTPTTTTSAQDHYVLPRTPKRSLILGSPHKHSADIVKTPTLQLNSALGLLHQKSEEIADLRARISDGEEERRALLERIARLEADKVVADREQAASIEQNPEPLSREFHELKFTFDELQETHETTVKERDGLDAEVNLLKIARDDAEKNASLFKGLYTQASSFVDGLREENADLRSRLRLAESQVSKGVQLVRAEYTARVNKLRGESEKSQLLLTVLQEKDRRTDDEVRRKAAREPELLAKIDELRQNLQEQKADLGTVLRQRNDLIVENKQLVAQIAESLSERSSTQRELRRLKVELARFSARERSIKKMIDPLHSLDQDEDAEGEDEDPDEVDVFVCNWALDDGAERCGEIFLSRQDLQDHLFLVGHL